MLQRLQFWWTLAAPLAALLLHAAAEEATAGLNRSEDEVTLLQFGPAIVEKRSDDQGYGHRWSDKSMQASPDHYWPHARGHVHHYSQTPYKMPMNLSSSFAWMTEFGNATVVWGVLIDAKKNLYVASLGSVSKHSPDGRKLWQSELSSEMPSLVGNTLVGMRMFDCLAFALDLDTGKALWKRQIWPNNGAHGDFVEAHSGVAVVGVGTKSNLGVGGASSAFAAGFKTSDGTLLWHFAVDCGLWNIMALFPDEETTIFQDQCGGVYRVGLHNGTLLWHTRGEAESFTDGGAMLGPDGSTYTCSNPANASGQAGESGLLRKYRLGDGARLWTAELPYPCVNFPAVSVDGRSVIVAPGALAIVAKTKEFTSAPPAQQDQLYKRELALGNKQRAFYGLPDLGAAIMAIDAETGKVHWRHEVEPWGRLAFARDEQRAYTWLKNPSVGIPHCWPAHWSGPTVDDEGTVYIARSTGDIYVYNPQQGEARFPIGDGTLMAGAAFAPGMMAVTSCSSLFVFKTPGL